MMAATAVGVFPTMNECISQWVTPLLGESEAPDPKLATIYERHFATYLQARHAMAPIWPELSGRPA